MGKGEIAFSGREKKFPLLLEWWRRGEGGGGEKGEKGTPRFFTGGEKKGTVPFQPRGEGKKGKGGGSGPTEPVKKKNVPYAFMRRGRIIEGQEKRGKKGMGRGKGTSRFPSLKEEEVRGLRKRGRRVSYLISG